MKRLLRIMLGPVAHACAALLLAAIVCCPASAQTPPPSAPAPAAAAAGPRQAEPQAPAVAPANEPASPPTSAAAQLPRDLSPWGMFLSADIVVKAVMIGLAFASFVTWTIALARIGATAPFVGLFGTVWGIMNSFIGISKSHATNLAIVAPGIAEALLATALGLAAAIPAVVIYNVFSRSIAGYRALFADAAAEVLRLV